MLQEFERAFFQFLYSEISENSGTSETSEWSGDFRKKNILPKGIVVAVWFVNVDFLF